MKTDIETKNAGRYLQQLCKHWSHKAEVEFSPSRGQIIFPDGKTVDMAADEAALTIIANVPDGGDSDQFCGVVEEHIKRFAYRETMEFSWEASESLSNV